MLIIEWLKGRCFICKSDASPIEWTRAVGVYGEAGLKQY